MLLSNCSGILRTSVHTALKRDTVPSDNKVKSSISSSGFSGYIRVRPPEPKRDVECKETKAKEAQDGVPEMQRKAS
jgi:hypothetical protein